MDNAYFEDAMKWLSYANDDLGVAQHLFETYYPKPLAIICFHCQQAAEKAIKAIIILHGSQGGMPKKHDILLLLKQVKNIVTIENKLYDYADTLAPYSVEMRYPNELELTELHAKKAIDMAQEFIKWANDIVLVDKTKQDTNK